MAMGNGVEPQEQTKSRAWSSVRQYAMEQRDRVVFRLPISSKPESHRIWSFSLLSLSLSVSQKHPIEPASQLLQLQYHLQ